MAWKRISFRISTAFDDSTSTWIEYSDSVVLPEDWLKHDTHGELPVELPDDVLIQLEPGKCFKWRILREVLLRHLDEVKNLELVDLFYNPKAKAKAQVSRGNLEVEENGLES